MVKHPKSNSSSSLSQDKRKYVSQNDVPGTALDVALKVGQAITDNYAKQPTKPMHVANAMGLSPGSSYFRLLTGASIAYGITEGGAKAPLISLTPLGKQIFAPKSEGEDHKGKQTSILTPRVLKEFLSRYNNSALPADSKISLNVLEEMGVASTKLRATYDLIIQNAKYVGFLKEIKGKNYIDLEGSEPPQTLVKEEPNFNNEDNEIIEEGQEQNVVVPERPETDSVDKDARLKKVFITHGKNKAFLDAIKKLLGYSELLPVVAIEKTTVAKGLPDKVMDEMRSCGAAIIHVDVEEKLVDEKKKERVILNQNVLIEIGAAMALYGKRFILLVHEGIELPSNLDGLFEVRYSGEDLSADVAIKLLDAIKDIKNHQLP